MKVMISIQHPAHVHFFKNAIFELIKEGHNVKVVARKKALVSSLLEQYGISYKILAGSASSIVDMGKVQIKYEYRLFFNARQFKPDVMLAIGEPAVSHVGTLLKIPTILFTDTEHAALSNKLALPFADRVCTPVSFTKEVSGTQVRYPGYHELAYLHPNRYEPDVDICVQHGINPDKKLAVIRLISWNAIHDVGHAGLKDLQKLIAELKKEDLQIVITSEGEYPPQLEQYQMTVPPHHIHDLLYYADVFVGEGATMAIESAVLGTPAVFVSTLEAGVLNELETEYGLLRTVTEPENTDLTVQAVTEMLELSPSVLKDKQSRLINNKVDTTSVILDQIMEMVA